MSGSAVSEARRALRLSPAAILAAACLMCPPAAARAGAGAPARAGAPGGAGAPGSGTTAAASGGSPSAATATLSNLRTLTRWAYPQAPAAVHLHPSASSRVLGRLRFLTGDGQAAVYVGLRSFTTGGATWILVPIPGRPNGLVGWVPAGALGELQVTREYLRVDRERLRATLYRDGRPIWSARIGVGRPSLPTPAGHFYVTEKLTAIGGPFYGPYALGTSAYSPELTDWPGGGIVGIHGTDAPQLIPGRPSHGCIRLRNADIARLWPLVQVGTPVEIV
jgi:L,D-transpeptidase catalytic domain